MSKREWINIYPNKGAKREECCLPKHEIKLRLERLKKRIITWDAEVEMVEREPFDIQALEKDLLQVSRWLQKCTNEDIPFRRYDMVMANNLWKYYSLEIPKEKDTFDDVYMAWCHRKNPKESDSRVEFFANFYGIKLNG